MYHATSQGMPVTLHATIESRDHHHHYSNNNNNHTFFFMEPDTRGRGGCTQFVHGRSRMTIDPRIPSMPGRSTSGFHQPGRHWLHQARSAVRCWASRLKGELHPSKNRSQDGLRHRVPTFLLMDDSVRQ